MIGFTSRKVFASIIVMLCALFASPRVSGQTLEAYVQRNPEKTTLTFYYDDRRAARTGDTWGIDEKKWIYSCMDRDIRETQHNDYKSRV